MVGWKAEIKFLQLTVLYLINIYLPLSVHIIACQRTKCSVNEHSVLCMFRIFLQFVHMSGLMK